MNIEYNNFIGIFRDVYPAGYCEHLISEFDRLAYDGAGSSRQRSERASRHLKDDHQIFLNIKNHSALDFRGHNSVDMFFEGLQNCYDLYSEQFSILKNNGNIRATAMKMQKTTDGGGYHVWHCEQGPNEASSRVLVYALYLNTLPKESNGETEFMYQKLRFRPEENTMLLWPASFTHPHRGNPLYGDIAKYIVTGWFYYD